MPNRSQADIKLSDIGLWEVRTALNPFCFSNCIFLSSALSKAADPKRPLSW